MSLKAALKNMGIGEIMQKHPETEPVFTQFGLHTYAKTETAKYENLEAASLVHALNLPALLDALKDAIEK